MSGWFNNYNSNKLSISLNLRAPEARSWRCEWSRMRT